MFYYRSFDRSHSDLNGITVTVIFIASDMILLQLLIIRLCFLLLVHTYNAIPYIVSLKTYHDSMHPSYKTLGK